MRKVKEPFDSIDFLMKEKRSFIVHLAAESECLKALPKN
jgi:hypothetical protein